MLRPEDAKALQVGRESLTLLAGRQVPAYAIAALQDAADEVLARLAPRAVLRHLGGDRFEIGITGDTRTVRVTSAGAAVFALAVTEGPEAANELVDRTTTRDARLGDLLSAQRSRLATWLEGARYLPAAAAVRQVRVRARDGVLSVIRR